MSSRQFPVGAVVDADLHAKLDALAADLPAHLENMVDLVDDRAAHVSYDPARAHLAGLIEPQVPALLDGPVEARCALVGVADNIIPHRLPEIIARLVHDSSSRVRRVTQTALRYLGSATRARYDLDQYLERSQQRPPVTRHVGDRSRQEALGVPVLETVADLRKLLGIRSERQLGFLLVASDVGDPAPYTCFEIPKRDGKARLIAAPGPQLKHVQRKILEHILYQIPVSAAAHGFVPGRSTVTHAACHSGRDLIVGFDLKDFFPSIHSSRVLGLFGSLGYRVGDARFSKRDDDRAVAPVLARLCSYTDSPESWGDGYTPQGAPTSPAISNLICRRLDGRLEGLAKTMNGTYTRYADDLAFSFDHSAAPAIGKLRWFVGKVCNEEGFALNPDKFRVMRKSRRQQVTGIVVNDCLRIPRAERRRFRAILHNCKRDGIESQRQGHPRFEQLLHGYAAYLYMVHPDEGREALADVKRLLGGAA